VIAHLRSQRPAYLADARELVGGLPVAA
jgi:hypothetical protein